MICEPGQPEMELHSRLPGTSIFYPSEVPDTTSKLCLCSINLMDYYPTSNGIQG